jgi:response regulator RpfG family c-di-GMP phosphodiesterase
MVETEKRCNVLYLDDEVNNLKAFKANFRRVYQVFITDSIQEARRILEENEIHVIISDQRMPEMKGIDFFATILKEHPEPIRMLLTGYADINAVIDAINKGQVYKYFSKPWDDTDLRENIDKAFELYKLRKENHDLTDKLMDVNQKLEFLLRQKLLS